MTDDNYIHKHNAALLQAEKSFNLDRAKGSADIAATLNAIFGKPWSQNLEAHSVDDIKNAIIAARAARGDKPPVSAPPKSRPPVTGSARQQGESYQDYIRRKYTVTIKRKKKDGTFTEFDYLQAAGRILLWRADYPPESGWQLITKEIFYNAESAVIKASIINPAGVTIATAFGWATNVGDDAKNFGGRFWEKAETTSVARVLARLGYGTEEPDDDHLADTPVDQ